MIPLIKIKIIENVYVSPLIHVDTFKEKLYNILLYILACVFVTNVIFSMVCFKFLSVTHAVQSEDIAPRAVNLTLGYS